MTSARRVVIHGRVQGVGFRYAAIDAADRLGVTGWVRNRHDGTVEALLQGSDAAMAAMLEWCRHGPPHSEVRDVEVNVAAPEALADFTLRPTA